MTETTAALELPEPYWWQQHLSDVSLELVRRPGTRRMRLAYDNAGAIVNRQGGKTAWVVSRITMQARLPDEPPAILGGPIVPQHVGYLAQTRKHAVEKWAEHVEIIMDSPLAGEVANINRKDDDECLTWHNRSWYRPITPNRTGARGLSLDVAVMDEAMAHRIGLISAVRPTMGQRDGVVKGIGAQLVLLSTAGDEGSELLDRETELGRAAVKDPRSSRCWLEWSADPECDHLDEAVWFATLPTLGIPNGISLSFLRSEAEGQPAEFFKREYLGIPTRAGGGQVIPKPVWADCHRGDVILPIDGLVYAIDVTPERNRAALVASGCVENYLPVEVLEAAEGVEWLLERTAASANMTGAPVVVDVVGPAASLIPALEARGVVVIPASTREATAAAATFYDAAMARRLAHLDDWRLNDAVAGATKRKVGDRWLWDRRGTADICTLVAASLAVWGADTGQGGAPAIY